MAFLKKKAQCGICPRYFGPDITYPFITTEDYQEHMRAVHPNFVPKPEGEPVIVTGNRAVRVIVESVSNARALSKARLV